ncbi:MAG: TIGR02147 family protein [Fibrobacteria bacterium]|nr:TIGR02147 family protein [Fibrobacteria bacterium]
MRPAHEAPGAEGSEIGRSPDLFGYTDYRRYLADAWAARKERDRKFSHRAIAAKAGFSSSAFFGRILSGEANLTPTAALRLAAIFGLSRVESRYFEHLVLFDQARSQEERALFLDRIVSWRKGKVPRLEADQIEFCENWWVVVVRELLDLVESDGDPKVLARMLRPPATPTQVKHALDLLQRLSLVEKDAKGIWRKTEAVLSTGDLAATAIDTFRKETLKLAAEALDRFPPSERSLSTLTVTLSPATFERLRDRFRHLRSEILDMAREDREADRVIQVNIQAFPLAIRDRRPPP